MWVPFVAPGNKGDEKGSGRGKRSQKDTLSPAHAPPTLITGTPCIFPENQGQFPLLFPCPDPDLKTALSLSTPHHHSPPPKPSRLPL